MANIPLVHLQEDAESGSQLADYFREPDAVMDSPLAWQLDHANELADSVRLLFQGPNGLVRLRIWMLLTLVGQGQAQWLRDEMDRLFHLVRPEATDAVLKRFREARLIEWDETHRTYALTPLGQRVAAVLAPLAEPPQDELAHLLGQVVGADQLGTLQGSHVHALQAQLQRMHHEFEDAIASGSEFRLRQSRQRYDRASRLIDKASTAIASIISQYKGQKQLEQAVLSLGLAQSRLLAMAGQFNRALQQADRQRITLGTTGITSTDVKRWLQSHANLTDLAQAALHRNIRITALAQQELLDVTEAEFERDRPQTIVDEGLPTAQVAPSGSLQAIALPSELGDLVQILSRWQEAGQETQNMHSVKDTLLGESLPADARYTQIAYKLQLLPLLGDAQAQSLPGATGDLARQPWRVHWHNALDAFEHPNLTHLSAGDIRLADAMHPLPETENP
jgi:hypothetical protein